MASKKKAFLYFFQKLLYHPIPLSTFVNGSMRFRGHYCVVETNDRCNFLSQVHDKTFILAFAVLFQHGIRFTLENNKRFFSITRYERKIFLYQNCCYNQRPSSIKITLTDFSLLSRPHKSTPSTPSSLKCVFFMIQSSNFQLKVRSISISIKFYQSGFAQELILKYLYY